MAKSGHLISQRRQPVHFSGDTTVGYDSSSASRTFCGQKAMQMSHFLHHPRYISTLFICSPQYYILLGYGHTSLHGRRECMNCLFPIPPDGPDFAFYIAFVKMKNMLDKEFVGRERNRIGHGSSSNCRRIISKSTLKLSINAYLGLCPDFKLRHWNEDSDLLADTP